MEAKKYTKSKCRKLMVGQVLWCPQLTKAKGIYKWIQGGHIGSQYCQYKAVKGGVTHQIEHMDLAPEHIKSKIRQAYKLYLRLKNDKGR